MVISFGGIICDQTTAFLYSPFSLSPIKFQLIQLIRFPGSHFANILSSLSAFPLFLSSNVQQVISVTQANLKPVK